MSRFHLKWPFVRVEENEEEYIDRQCCLVSMLLLLAFGAQKEPRIPFRQSSGHIPNMLVDCERFCARITPTGATTYR